MEENLYSNCIRTYTGKYVDIFNPVPEMICIEDIAHSLSMQCRFGGHTVIFYSVAQHCVHASQLASVPLELTALLHDASEAYALDIPRPIKLQIPEYKKCEDKLMKVIAEKFGFLYPFPDKVKQIDNQLLEYEWHNYVIKPIEDINTGSVLSPFDAEMLFLDTFKSIGS